MAIKSENSYGKKIIYNFFKENIYLEDIAEEAKENANMEAGEYAFKNQEVVRKFVRDEIEDAFYNEINNFDINKESLEQFRISDIYKKLKNEVVDELMDEVLASFLEEVEWQVI